MWASTRQAGACRLSNAMGARESLQLRERHRISLDLPAAPAELLWALPLDLPPAAEEDLTELDWLAHHNIG